MNKLLFKINGKQYKRITKHEARKTNRQVFVCLVKQKPLSIYTKLFEIKPYFDFDLQVNIIEYYNGCYELGHYLEYLIEYNCLEALKTEVQKIETQMEATKWTTT